MADSWKIPMADPLVGEEEARAVYEVVLSGWLSAGPKVPHFEQTFAELVGTGQAVAFCNGTVALQAMLLALGIGAGDEVIVPAITFISSATSVLHAGAMPVFADVDPLTLNIDPVSVERCLTRRTRAIMAVHYAGQAADMDPLLEIGERQGIPVLEDAAQAHGAEYRGRRAGRLGRAAMFSFTPNKNITTGEGGMVTTDDEDFAGRLRLLRNHGSRVTYLHEVVGYNFRMTEMQAAVGIEQLKKLPAILAHKRSNAAYLSERLSLLPGILVPVVAPGRTHTFMLYTIMVNEPDAPISRDRLGARLEARGIQTRVAYPPVHLQPIFRERGGREGQCPQAERAAGQLLTLPFHGKLTQSDLDYLIESIAGALC
jgi:perosamine synthetase